MTSAPTVDVADVATTPGALLVRVRAARAVADDAETQVLELAVEWAHAHPLTPGGGGAWRVRAPRTLVGPGLYEVDATVEDALVAGDFDAVEWCGIPPVAWDAPASFAAANRMSTGAGQALIRDALVIRHRLPLLWARLVAREVPAWRARRVAAAVLGAPADVVEAIDAQISPIADQVGPAQLKNAIEAALTRLHAELREIESLEKLDACYVRLDERSLNHTGIAELIVRGDWKDLHDFDQAVGLIAAALAAHGSTESLDVRRTLAVGVLADPAGAQQLLDDLDQSDDHDDTTGPTPSTGRLAKRTVLHLHLSAAALEMLGGGETLGRNENTGRSVLAAQIRDWCARTDTHLQVLPVLDLTEHLASDAYEIPSRLVEQVRGRHTHCVFPYCTRPVRACDLDHITPWQPDDTGGSTSTANLAPLCRHHHRLKTPHHQRPAWTYRPLDPVTDPGVYLWTDPHGLTYLVTPTGTTDISGSPPPASITDST